SAGTSIDGRYEVQGHWHGDFARIVGPRSACDQGDRRRTGARGGVEYGAKCREILNADPRWVSANIQLKLDVVVIRTRGVRVSGGQFREADEECLNRGWAMMGGNAFGELVLRRDGLLVGRSIFGSNSWLVLRRSAGVGAASRRDRPAPPQFLLGCFGKLAERT